MYVYIFFFYSSFFILYMVHGIFFTFFLYFFGLHLLVFIVCYWCSFITSVMHRVIFFCREVHGEKEYIVTEFSYNSKVLHVLKDIIFQSFVLSGSFERKSKVLENRWISIQMACMCFGFRNEKSQWLISIDYEKNMFIQNLSNLR